MIRNTREFEDLMVAQIKMTLLKYIPELSLTGAEVIARAVYEEDVLPQFQDVWEISRRNVVAFNPFVSHDPPLTTG